MLHKKGVRRMATSSIFREIRAKDKRSIYKLVRALERSEASKASNAEEVKMSRPVSDMTKEQMKKLFGGE